MYANKTGTPCHQYLHARHPFTNGPHYRREASTPSRGRVLILYVSRHCISALEKLDKKIHAYYTSGRLRGKNEYTPLASSLPRGAKTHSAGTSSKVA